MLRAVLKGTPEQLAEAMIQICRERTSLLDRGSSAGKSVAAAADNAAGVSPRGGFLAPTVAEAFADTPAGRTKAARPA